MSFAREGRRWSEVECLFASTAGLTLFFVLVSMRVYVCFEKREKSFTAETGLFALAFRCLSNLPRVYGVGAGIYPLSLCYYGIYLQRMNKSWQEGMPSSRERHRNSSKPSQLNRAILILQILIHRRMKMRE